MESLGELMASPVHRPTLLASTDATRLLAAVASPMPLLDPPTNAGRADGCVCVPEPGGTAASPRFPLPRGLHAESV